MNPHSAEVGPEHLKKDIERYDELNETIDDMRKDDVKELTGRQRRKALKTVLATAQYIRSISFGKYQVGAPAAAGSETSWGQGDDGTSIEGDRYYDVSEAEPLFGSENLRRADEAAKSSARSWIKISSGYGHDEALDDAIRDIESGEKEYPGSINMPNFFDNVASSYRLNPEELKSKFFARNPEMEISKTAVVDSKGQGLTVGDKVRGVPFGQGVSEQEGTVETVTGSDQGFVDVNWVGIGSQLEPSGILTKI